MLPHPSRVNCVGLEVGTIRTADPDNIYGDGPGKTLVLGIARLELRLFERYDLEDRTGLYGDAAGVRGRMSISSVGYRITLGALSDLIAIRGLVGVAWVRRPSLRMAVDEILSSFEYRQQHGIAAMLGGGVQLGPFVAEVRAYPTRWADLTGDARYTWNGSGQTTSQIAVSPGGTPITFTAGVGIAF